MSYTEIRHDHMFGPAVEPGCHSPEGDGLFAGVAIDGWETDNDSEMGCVIAQVLMSVHGDLIVAWHDNGARMDDNVLIAIDNAKQDLLELWAQKGNVVQKGKTQMKYKVRISELRYGEVTVEAEDEERAISIAAGKEIEWFDSETTDMTAERID